MNFNNSFSHLKTVLSSNIVLHINRTLPFSFVCSETRIRLLYLENNSRILFFNLTLKSLFDYRKLSLSNNERIIDRERFIVIETWIWYAFIRLVYNVREGTLYESLHKRTSQTAAENQRTLYRKYGVLLSINMTLSLFDFVSGR